MKNMPNLKIVQRVWQHNLVKYYDTDTLDDFIGKEGKQINYGDLYEHLCSAQYIADVLQDEHANQIMTIRQEVGEKLLKIHEDNAKC